VSGGCKGDLEEPLELFYAAVAGGVVTIERVDFLGTPVDLVSKESLFEAIDQSLEAGKRKQIIFATNAAKVTRCRRSVEFTRLLAQATYIIPDGAGVSFPLRAAGFHRQQRVTGVDTAEALLSQANYRSRSLYLFGANEEVVQAFACRIRTEFPQINLVGVRNGFVEGNEESFVLCDEISSLNPDYLFVARGTPLQERWLTSHLERLRFGVAIGLGGSFDVLTGRVQRAPDWARKGGVEWLYRTVLSPRARLGRTLKECLPLIPGLVAGVARRTIGRPWSKPERY